MQQIYKSKKCLFVCVRFNLQVNNRDGAVASWALQMHQYFRGVKCLAQKHNTAEVGAKFIDCDFLVKRVVTFGVCVYRNQCPVNCMFAELHVICSRCIRHKSTLVGQYFLKCNKIKNEYPSIVFLSIYLSRIIILKDTLFLYARLCVTKRFATSSECHSFMNY